LICREAYTDANLDLTGPHVPNNFHDFPWDFSKEIPAANKSSTTITPRNLQGGPISWFRHGCYPFSMQSQGLVKKHAGGVNHGVSQVMAS